MRARSDAVAAVIALAALVAVPMSWPLGAPRAQNADVDTLRKIEHDLEATRSQAKAFNRRASDLHLEIADLRQKMIAAARSEQDTEGQLNRLEKQLDDLRQTETALRQQLGGREKQIGAVLLGLERLALRPSEAMLFQPGDVNDTVRAAILLRAVIPELHRRTAVVRDKLTRLAVLGEDITNQKARIDVEAARLDGQRAALAALAARKDKLANALERKSRSADSKSRELARAAGSLRDLLARLRREQETKKRAAAHARRLAALATRKPNMSSSASMPIPQPDPRQDLRGFHGLTPPPVRGWTIIRYGQKDIIGVVAKGLTIETRPLAQVVAPADAVIVFSGPFRGYGQLLILDHGEECYTLLAGLGRIDVAEGRKVLAGEPLGAMLNTNGAHSGRPQLYVEFRKCGVPAAPPQSWLVADGGASDSENNAPGRELMNDAHSGGAGVRGTARNSRR